MAVPTRAPMPAQTRTRMARADAAHRSARMNTLAAPRPAVVRYPVLAARIRRLVLTALEATAGAMLHALAIRIDRLRGPILTVTLRVRLIERIFRDRAKRLAVIFIVSLFVALGLALTVPLWMLLAVPLVLGVPHLAASLSFVPRLTVPANGEAGAGIAVRAGACFLAVAGIRLWAGASGPAILERFPNGIELAAAFIAAVWLASVSGAGAVRAAATAMILCALGAASLAAPAETLGALVLAHNFVGFAYWIARAPTAADRRVATGALTFFALATAAIFAGAFDAILAQRASSIFAGALSDVDIGQTILPNSQSEIFWSRAVSAFAFGQSLHYFVWLRAIPEQELPHGHPIGFSKSVRLIERDSGRLVLYGAAYGLAGLFAYALVRGWLEARLLYLTAAAFHGYFEIAGLALIRRALPARAR